MITDQETNTLFLADTLPVKHPYFFEKFKTTLNNHGITFCLLPGTKDIWAVDYMPIQIEQNKFIQFTYSPSYLRLKKYYDTISDVDSICQNIGIGTDKSTIILDGGNVIRATDKVVMTDRIFKENPHIPKKQLVKQLENFLEVDQIIFIPADPNDFTGHADGMIRFIMDDTVLINRYVTSEEKSEFLESLYLSLRAVGLKYIEVPYNPYSNKKKDSAKGTYLNYLQMKNIIITPTFGMNEDEQTLKLYEKIFYGYKVLTIDSNEIAERGGVLNCITWNIKM